MAEDGRTAQSLPCSRESPARYRSEEHTSRSVCFTSRGIHILTFVTVAIAYLLQKTPYVFPIIGGRKVEHLLANAEALEISLTPEQIEYLESQKPFDKGFPMNRFVSPPLH